MRILEALIDGYRGEKIGRPARQIGLSEVERQLMSNVRRMCDWRLGRHPLGDNPIKEKGFKSAPKTVDEVILCLKRILKSANKWSKAGGRQGYLNFVAQYVV